MEVMNKQAVAAYLGISERTLENLVKARKLPAPVKLGKQAFWAEEVVQRYRAGLFERQLQFNPALGVCMPVGTRLVQKKRAQSAAA